MTYGNIWKYIILSFTILYTEKERSEWIEYAMVMSGYRARNRTSGVRLQRWKGCQCHRKTYT